MTGSPAIDAIVLAAGRSSRFEKGNKLLEPLNGKPLLLYAIDAALQSRCRRVYCVTGQDAPDILNILSDRDVIPVHNPDFRDGMSTSLRAGVAALEQTIDGFMVLPGDMPGINAPLIDRLINHFSAGRISVPVHDERSGHPVLFPITLAEEFDTLEGDRGARGIIKNHDILVDRLPVDTKTIHIDLDDEETFKVYCSS